jgi:hypothetical protein
MSRSAGQHRLVSRDGPIKPEIRGPRRLQEHDWSTARRSAIRPPEIDDAWPDHGRVWFVNINHYPATTPDPVPSASKSRNQSQGRGGVPESADRSHGDEKTAPAYDQMIKGRYQYPSKSLIRETRKVRANIRVTKRRIANERRLRRMTLH